MAFVFKTIESSHVTINPFYANKLWQIGSTTVDLTDTSSYYVDSEVSMSIYYGEQITTTWDPSSEPQTTHGEYVRDIWNSVNNLYYRDFATAPLNCFPQAVNLVETRSLDSTIVVWSIPQEIIGKGIERGSFIVTAGGDEFIDDGNGNILLLGGPYAGNIIYNQGIIIWSNSNTSLGGTTSISFDTCTFRSTKLIHSTEVICVSEADEHNMSGNTSLLAIQSTAQNPGIGSNEPGTYNNDGECYHL